MFAVPGWSVSAYALKTQVEPKSLKLGRDSKPPETEEKSRKRKRGRGSSKGIEVTEGNFGELWKKHIEKIKFERSEGKVEGTTERRKKKKSGKDNDVGNVQEDNLGVNGNTFKGILEGGDVNDIKSEDVPVRKKKKRQESNYQEQENAPQENGHVQDPDGPPNQIEAPHNVDDGKTKYERRRGKAEKKREQKALLQANGSIPPIRPEPMTKNVAAPQAKPMHPANSSEASKPPQNLQGPSLSESKDLSKTSDPSKPAKIPQPSDTPTSNTKLTPLQQCMAAKLISSRFRHLNEVLYTLPSDQAMRLFTQSPQNYTSYHAGFRAQVAVWPKNPVECFIEDAKTRGNVSVPSQKKGKKGKKGKKPKEPPSDGGATNGNTIGKVDPLPRTRGICTIADLGCGDAHLAASLHPLQTALNLSLLSFDLARGDTPNVHLITVADTSNLFSVGIRDSSVDIAICCLSLMGTNWVSVVDECSRIVRGGGEVWVAEIKSRFARPVQTGKKEGDGIWKKKKAKVEDEEEEDPPALEEIEEAKGLKDETDVSAFVEVFRRRGFNMKGEPDMANKMFVRMRFTKSFRPENEKGGAAKFGDGFRGKQAKTKYLEDEGRVVDESKVLKPCAYKIR